MGKLSVYLAFALVVISDESLAGYSGRYKNWEQFDGNHIGFGSNKCAALSGMLPTPQSGCCGKHAEGNDAGGDGDQDDDWANGVGDDYDIGNDDDGNWWSNWFHAKRSAEQNASDTAPDKYITAGTPAGLRQFPWLVRLQIKYQKGYDTMVRECGGSLISPRFVLTAAHCVDVNYQSYNDIDIILSEYDTRTFPTDCVGSSCVNNIVVKPDKVIKHSKYHGSTLHDIALMRLRVSAPYTDYIRPICLPPFNVDNRINEGASLVVSGWGDIGTGRPASPIKLKTQVQLVPNQNCRRYYRALTTGQICTSGLSGQDTCQGDSGGPLMMEYNGNFYVVGIVSAKSASYQCGSSYPTLFTNVFAYTKWIKQQMGNQ